jgi:hypothetical protein
MVLVLAWERLDSSRPSTNYTMQGSPSSFSGKKMALFVYVDDTSARVAVCPFSPASPLPYVRQAKHACSADDGRQQTTSVTGVHMQCTAGLISSTEYVRAPKHDRTNFRLVSTSK